MKFINLLLQPTLLLSLCVTVTHASKEDHSILGEADEFLEHLQHQRELVKKCFDEHEDLLHANFEEEGEDLTNFDPHNDNDDHNMQFFEQSEDRILEAFGDIEDFEDRDLMKLSNDQKQKLADMKKEIKLSNKRIKAFITDSRKMNLKWIRKEKMIKRLGRRSLKTAKFAVDANGRLLGKTCKKQPTQCAAKRTETSTKNRNLFKNTGELVEADSRLHYRKYKDFLDQNQATAEAAFAYAKATRELVLSLMNSPDFEGFQQLFTKTVARMESQVALMSNLTKKATAATTGYKRVLYESICVELVGVSRNIRLRERKDFISAIFQSLPSIMEEGTTFFNMRSFNIVTQSVTTTSVARRTQEETEEGENEHRLLSRSSLNANGYGSWDCDCDTDVINGDAFRRRLDEGSRRHLVSEDTLTAVGEKMKGFLTPMFPEIEAVKFVDCRTQ